MTNGGYGGDCRVTILQGQFMIRVPFIFPTSRRCESHVLLGNVNC